MFFDIHLLETCNFLLMKKQLLAAAFTFSTLFTFKESTAQVQVGIRGGFNSTNYTDTELNNKSGFNAGIVAYSNLEKPLFFQSGLLFNQKGAQVNLLGFKSKFEFNYLEIPLNVGYSFPVGNMVKVAPYAGPYIAYAINAHQKTGGEKVDLFKDSKVYDDYLDPDYSIEFSSKPKRVDFGANVGVGLHFGNKIIVNGQYNQGLTNIIFDSKNKGLSFGLTYLF